MARYISRGMFCIVCNKSATHVTEYTYKDAEGLLCSWCNSRYITNMQNYLDRDYPEIYHAHERVLKSLITVYGPKED